MKVDLMEQLSYLGRYGVQNVPDKRANIMIVAQVCEDLVRWNRVQIRQGISRRVATHHEIVKLITAAQPLSSTTVEVLDAFMGGEYLLVAARERV